MNTLAVVIRRRVGDLRFSAHSYRAISALFNTLDFISSVNIGSLNGEEASS